MQNARTASKMTPSNEALPIADLAALNNYGTNSVVDFFHQVRNFSWRRILNGYAKNVTLLPPRIFLSGLWARHRQEAPLGTCCICSLCFCHVLHPGQHSGVHQFHWCDQHQQHNSFPAGYPLPKRCSVQHQSSVQSLYQFNQCWQCRRVVGLGITRGAAALFHV